MSSQFESEQISNDKPKLNPKSEDESSPSSDSGDNDILGLLEDVAEGYSFINEGRNDYDSKK